MAAQKTITVDIQDLDDLSLKATRLDALLHLTDDEFFREMGADSQEALLWTCSELAIDLKQIASRLWNGSV